MSRTQSRLTWTVLVVLVCTYSLPSATSLDTDEEAFAALLDVVVFDAACMNSTTLCEGERVQHLVEYYGADWCEPCELIELEIDRLNRTDTFVLQHHASVLDDSFFNASKFKFEYEHRLLFIPSIVINGQGLLTGSSQGLELASVLSQRNTTFTGFQNLSLNNVSLSWNATHGDRVSVWATEPVDHESRDRTHPNLATGMMAFNASNGQANLSEMQTQNGGSIVVLLERSGIYRLVTDSANPTGGMAVFDGERATSANQENTLSPGVQATAWTVILFIALLPAIYLRWKISRQAPSPPEEE